MIDKIKKILGASYYPLNQIEISKKQLLDNYHYLSSINTKIQIAPVIKSNAYGHGIEEVSKILDKENPPFFCVDSIYEAYALKKAQIKSPILIMGFVDPRNVMNKKLPFSFAIFDIESARILNKYQPDAKIHIKVDTGMNRIGVQMTDIDNFLSRIKKLKYLQVEGIMSHFSSPRTSKTYTDKQIKNYGEALKIFINAGIIPKWRHLAASGGLFNTNTKVLGDMTNLARCGIALYGATAEGKTRPILKLKSQIVHIKQLEGGNLVGYDGTYKTRTKTTIGILPIGYNDGVDRRLSNCGMVNYHGITCPIIGRVSMNITTIDITKIKNPKIGDEVIVISPELKSKNNVIKLAKVAETIPHDLLVHLHAKSLRRVVI